MNMLVLGRPLRRQGMLIQVDACLGTPIDVYRSLVVRRQRVLDDGLDRRKAGSAGQQDHRFARFFTQIEAAVRAIEAQDVAHFHA